MTDTVRILMTVMTDTVRILMTVMTDTVHTYSNNCDDWYSTYSYDFDCNDVRVIQRQETEQVRWRVVAVVCHTGTTPNSGNFWAWRRVPDSEDKFVRITDSTVTGDIVEYDDFSKIDDAFMLFLEPAEANEIIDCYILSKPKY